MGTELGIHVSFDDGASWQSLQCNLPVTPIYDLVVKDTDLVVATHGRSFWILDDLTPLHQMHDDLLDRESVPAQATRRRAHAAAHRRCMGRHARRQELPRHQWPERHLLHRRARDRSRPQAGHRCRRRPRARRSHHVLPRPGRGRRGQPHHSRRRRQRGRDVLERHTGREEGSRRVVHHCRRGHEHVPVADDLPERREDGRHRVPQATGRTACEARRRTERR